MVFIKAPVSLPQLQNRKRSQSHVPGGFSLRRDVFPLFVQAEGLEQSFSSSLLLEVSASQSSFSKDVTFSFPADVVKGSERVSVSAVGM